MTRSLGLRVTDQETARAVAVYKADSETIIGSGCLVSGATVLTCRHVVRDALGLASNEQLPAPSAVPRLRVKLIGVTGQPEVAAIVKSVQSTEGYASDIALLELHPESGIAIEVPPVEFATPLRHGGKTYSVFGFPGGNPQGRNVTGVLHAADALGLVQMDGLGPLRVREGCSGAPVWCHELGAFVGLVVIGLEKDPVAWCIPSRLLCAFHNELDVRFRIPPADRPRIHDYSEDDPNRQLFGTVSDDGFRRLTAEVDWIEDDERYTVSLRYERYAGSPRRGGYVTFITYPGFGKKKEDSYELFARVDENGVAEETIYPTDLFTVAAVGDGGDTALTLNLEELER